MSTKYHPYLNTHRHYDDETRGHVGVKQIVAQSPLQDEDDFKTGKVACGIHLRAIRRFVADQCQLGQFNVPVNDQGLLGVPLKDEIVSGMRH